jgi:hypothetical protein
MRAKFVNENIRFERGQDPKASMMIGVIQHIVDDTYEAYSFDRYGEKLWKEIIAWLLEGGYSPEEIELILGSKFMRWGMDYMEDRVPNQVSLKDFDDYFSDHEDDIQEMIEDELGSPELEENVVAGGTGGVSAPMATLANTPGVGNVIPGAGPDGIGSGDRFDNAKGPYTQDGKKKKKKKKRAKKVNEEYNFERGQYPKDAMGIGDKVQKEKFADDLNDLIWDRYDRYQHGAPITTKIDDGTWENDGEILKMKDVFDSAHILFHDEEVRDELRMSDEEIQEWLQRGRRLGAFTKNSPIDWYGRKLNEMNINPHDPVGVAMAKKLGAALPFEKGKGDQDVRQKRIDKDIDLDTDEDDVMSIEEWQKKFLGVPHGADKSR